MEKRRSVLVIVHNYSQMKLNASKLTEKSRISRNFTEVSIYTGDGLFIECVMAVKS